MPQSTLNRQPVEGLLVLFKGDSGTGKSVGALSFPKPYVFDFDRKMPSISLKHYPNKDVHYDTFKDMWELSERIEEFSHNCPYETLIIDSFTSLANLAIETVAITKGETVPEMLKRVQDTKGKNKQLEMMPIDYYGGEDRACTWFISQIKKLQARPGNPRYVVVIAHILAVESAPDLKTKIVTRTRSIVSKGRKVAAWLPTEFDDVYVFGYEQGGFDDNFKNAKPKRICITESYDEDAAKCSLSLPMHIEFTNASLFDIIQREAKSRFNTKF